MRRIHSDKQLIVAIPIPGPGAEIDRSELGFTVGIVIVLLASGFLSRLIAQTVPRTATTTVQQQVRVPIQGPVIQNPITLQGPVVTGPSVPQPVLRGFVDLHTHPMANLAFGGKLIYGGVDVGSLLPADPNCNQNVRATTELQALGHDGSTHGGPGFNLFSGFNNGCGNTIREQLMHVLQQQLKSQGQNALDPPGDAEGYPSFAYWPAWNDLTHQKMWVEWIRRAYYGGLRVMVALAVNNKTLGDALTIGTISGHDLPTDDRSEADLQIAEIKSFVGRHPDFMEVALSSADINRIVSANRLAVVIGMEIDHIGNFQQVFYQHGVPSSNEVSAAVAAASVPPTADAVRAEIDRLYAEGVRYIFPIHLLDNAFGGTAAYEDLFNISTLRESGHAWDLVCTDPNEYITYQSSNIDPTLAQALQVVSPFPIPNYVRCPVGQKNRRGLTPLGVVAIKKMMSLGMLIDIDHMSQTAADQTLALACYADPNKVPQNAPGNLWQPSAPCSFGYPLNSGHNALRTEGVPPWSERGLRSDQYWLIGQLHGMAGVGSAHIDAREWLAFYRDVVGRMRGTVLVDPPPDIVAGFGTDADGMEFQMPARDTTGPFGPNPNPLPAVQYNNTFPQSRDGNKIWNYNTDGVAHYGMLWDFLQDARNLGGGAVVDNNLMWGADYFFHTWAKAEKLAPWAALL